MARLIERGAGSAVNGQVWLLRAPVSSSCPTRLARGAESEPAGSCRGRHARHAVGGWSSAKLSAIRGGDVDTICAMTGALAGALCGHDGLPTRWLANLAGERPGVEEMKDLGRALIGS